MYSYVWKEIKIDDDVYMIRVHKGNREWKVLLTNLIEIWIELLTDESILEKCKKLNPLLNINAFDCQKIVQSIFTDIPSHIDNASVNKINLKARVEGGTIKFTLDLSKGTPQQLWENIIKPLCDSSMELKRQHEILLDLIKRKDEEIAEYKAEGAELVRKHIETEVFHESIFKSQHPLSKTTDYIDTFNKIIEFYNVDLKTLHAKEECDMPSNSTSEIIKIEPAVSDHEEVKLKPRRTTAQVTSNKRMKNNKDPIVIRKRNKRVKKLSDFIS